MWLCVDVLIIQRGDPPSTCTVPPVRVSQWERWSPSGGSTVLQEDRAVPPHIDSRPAHADDRDPCGCHTWGARHRGRSRNRHTR